MRNRTHSRLSVVGMACGALALCGSVTSCSRDGAGSDEEGGKIVRVSRQNNSGTYHYFREAVLGKGREYKLGSIDQSGSKDVVALVSKTPQAIGFSGMAFNSPTVKAVKISREKGGKAVAPTLDNVRSGEYPIARPLFIYAREEPTGATKDYMDWIRSEEGQQLVADTGYVPIQEPLEWNGIQSDEEATIQVRGSDSMVNLAQAWAEKYAEVNPKVTVQVAGGGSGDGISSLIDGTVDLANTSRRMKATELAPAKERNGVEPIEYVVGKDALAVYVHPDNPVDSLSLEELAGIYGEGGEIEHWSQVRD